MESDDNHRAILQLHMEYIKVEMDAAQLLYHAASFLKPADFEEVFNKSRESKATANECLAVKFMESENPGWFQGFIDTLTGSGFQTLVKRLTFQDVKEMEIYKNLLKVCYKELLTVMPSDITPHLVAKDIISQADCEVIQNKQRHENSQAGMQELLIRLPMRRDTWFRELVMALKGIGHQESLAILEPMLGDADTEEKVGKIVGKIKKANSEEMSLLSNTPYGEEIHESTRVYHADGSVDEKLLAANLDTPSRADESDKYPAKSINLNVGVATVMPSLSVTNACRDTDVKCYEPSGQQRSVWNQSCRPSDHNDDNDIVSLREDPDTETCCSGSSNATTNENNTMQPDSNRRVQPTDVRVTGLSGNVTVGDVVECFSIVANIKIDRNGQPAVNIHRDTVTGKVLGSAIVSFETAEDAQQVIEIFSDTELKGCHIFVEQAFQNLPSRQGTKGKPGKQDIMPRGAMNIGNSGLEHSLGASSTGTVVADGATGATEEPRELNLRSYQKELAQKAMEGKNCIVVAPTGSGKTHVALAIVKNHFAEWQKLTQQRPNNNREPKVVFFVPTVALVEQQRKMFGTYLGRLKTRGMSGDQDGQLAMEEIMSEYNVFVMTPQIMENALSLSDHGAGLLQLFSLLIFDECHHTNKNHPYNAIMSHYVDQVLQNEERKRPIYILPQVVGLTASVGVGKAKTTDQAVDHILKLCANLHCHEICTVIRNIADLAKNVNRPDEETKELQGRTNDPFHQLVCGIMKQIEEHMKSSQYVQDSSQDQPNLLLAPRDKGSDRYTQWINGLEKPIARINSQPSRRFFVSCQRNLMVYNTALLINADCRTIEALTYIDKMFNPANFDPSHLAATDDKTDEWLRKLFEDQKDRLTAISQDPRNINPKLEYLKRKILEFYEGNENSRGIIFVKTREMTVALVNWINETAELRALNPHNLVGTNAPAQRAGQTPFKQEDVLKCFKDGKHKVIVATSVAEEGLDVQQCNWVIRYEHVTNSTARIQSRGRARAEQAKYCLVAEQGRGVADKEMVNKIRECMMKNAIDRIQFQIKPEQIQMKIQKFQKLAKIERDMAIKGKEIDSKRRAERKPAGEAVFRCHKCDNYATHLSDIRTIEKSHHVILDSTYKERVIIRPHPTPKKFENFELTGKIYCKGCRWEWGVMGVYKKVSFPIIKISSFVIDINEERQLYKKWKDSPFDVKSLSPDDLTKMLNQSSNDMGSDEDDEIFDQLSDSEEYGSMASGYS